MKTFRFMLFWFCMGIVFTTGCTSAGTNVTNTVTPERIRVVYVYRDKPYYDDCYGRSFRNSYCNQYSNIWDRHYSQYNQPRYYTPTYGGTYGGSSGGSTGGTTPPTPERVTHAIVGGHEGRVPDNKPIKY